MAATDQPDAPATPKPGRYLSFQLAGRYFAIAVEHVREMMPAQLVKPWREAPPGFSGLITSQRRQVPVLNLVARLSLTPRENPPQHFIVIQTGGVEAGFHVDRLNDILAVRAHDLRGATIQGHGRPRAILDPHALLTVEDRLALRTST